MSTHNSFEEARAQATEYRGFAASEKITVGNKIFEIPNPNLLDADQQERVNALNADRDAQWDRYPASLNDDGSVKHRGALKIPHRHNGNPVNYNTRLAEAILGDDFDAFKKAGGRSNDVRLIWSKMNQELADRRDDDSKSGGSVPALALVPSAN